MRVVCQPVTHLGHVAHEQALREGGPHGGGAQARALGQAGHQLADRQPVPRPHRVQQRHRMELHLHAGAGAQGLSQDRV